MRRMRVVVHHRDLIVVAIREVLAPVPVLTNGIARRIEMVDGVEVFDAVPTVERSNGSVGAHFFHAVIICFIDLLFRGVITLHRATIEADIVVAIWALMLMPKTENMN
jgi:hypothetical protein